MVVSYAAGGAATTEAFIAALGASKATASRRLTAAAAAGRLKREGQGGRGGPQVWRVPAGETEDRA
jgi:predicted HTH transcriptional regulator